MKDQDKTKNQLIVELEEARQRISELEQSETEREQAEQALRESEERYRDLFEKVPVCLWEEDISKLKSYLDELRSSGVTDLPAYFQVHLEDLVHCAGLVEIIDANETAVQLAGVESKEQLLGNLDERFIDESYNSFQKEIIALYEGGGVFQGENISKSPQGNTIYSEINGKIAAGYEDTWARYLVSQMDITERVRAEKALRENEKLLRTIADNYPNSYISIIEKDFTAGFTSGQEFKKQNLDPEQFIGLTLEQVFNDQATIVRGHYEKTFDGEERSFELFVNGQHQHYRTVPLYAEDGSIPRILSVVENITERKQVELELKESEDRFRTIFNTEPECVKILNPDTTLVTMNPAGLAMIEAESLDMVKGQSVLPIIDKEFRDGFRKLTDNVCKKGQSGMLEFRITGLKGTPCWLETHAVPLRNSKGEVTGLLSITRDITERKKSERVLQERETELQSIFRAAPVGIGMTIDRVIQEANRMLCQMTGYTRDELIGQSARMLYLSTKDYEYVGAEKYRMIKEQGIGTVETCWKRKDGAICDILLSSVPLDPDDFSRGVTFTALDITSRKQAEIDLLVAKAKAEKSESQVKKLIEKSPLPMVITDSNQDIVFFNDKFTELFGYTLKDVSTADEWWQLAYPDEKYREIVQKSWVEAIERSIANNTDIEMQEWDLVVKDRTVRRCEFRMVPLSDVSLIIMNDITERKQAELELFESERRYRSIVESSPLGMHMYELQAPNKLVFSGSNPAADDILGVDNSIFVGKTIEEAFPPLDNTEVPERYKEAAAKGIPWRTEQIDYDSEGIKGAFEVIAFQTAQNKMVAMFHDITTRRQAEEALRMKTGELEALFSISSHLRLAQSADEMLPVVLQEIRRVMNTDAIAVILLDSDGEQFTYGLADGVLAPNTGRQFAVEKSVSGLVLKTRQPYVTEDLSSDPKKTTSLTGTEELGPTVVVPLQSEEEFLGVLVCGRAKDVSSSQFSTSEAQLLTAIGEMVGNALRRARLYDQALARLQNVQALHSIDMAITANMDLRVTLEFLLTQTISQLNADAACILLLDQNMHMLKYAAGNGFRTTAIESAQIRLGEGLLGQVALQRKSLHIADISQSEFLKREFLRNEGYISYQVAPLVSKGQVQGVLETFYRKQVTPDDENTEFLETLATQAAIAIDNAQLFGNLQRSNFELEMAYDATIEGWSRALELRDQETEGHTLRVTDMTMRLAQAMGVKGDDLIHIRQGALLHDIGKMGVPDRILLKPGKLDDGEWEIMKQHANYAFEMLWPIEFLRSSIDIPHCHHERWDGTGYPSGLKGDQIPLSARVFAVADVWDALTNDRPYRKAWTKDEALEYITTNSGKHFDPRVVETFLDLRDKSGQN